LSRCITAIDYDKYAKKYNDEKTELERKLVEFTKNDKTFVVTSSYLLQLASKAKLVFDSSQPAKKNKILKMLLANCTLDQKRLQLNLLKPFSALVLATKSSNWLALADTLRTDSIEFNEDNLINIKELLCLATV
jgi:hypothetical protein